MTQKSEGEYGDGCTELMGTKQSVSYAEVHIYM